MTVEELKRERNETLEDIEQLSILLLLYLEGKGGKNTDIRFDAAKGRFYVNGKSISISQIRKYLLRIERDQGRRISRLIDDLESGKITLAEWKERFDRSIRTTHLMVAALALGGLEVALSNTKVRELINEEIKYADNFAADIRKNANLPDGSKEPRKPRKPKGSVLSFRRIKSRAKSYYRKAAITYGILEQTAREQLGIQTECKRILRAAESCRSCLYWAGKGWIPIADQPPVGSNRLICERYCRCYLIYR